LKLIVRHAEREEAVQVRRHDDGYEVVVGDRTYQVDAALARPGVYSLRLDGQQHEVAVRPQGAAGTPEGIAWWVSGGGTAGPVQVQDPLAHLAAQAVGAKGGRRKQRVTAYMPGRVVALLVEEGEEVKAGQGVVVLEAMKMENEIRAEHDGVVTRILVQPGQSVDGGNPLFEME
jgi:biotin carboxyl carrier protein